MATIVTRAGKGSPLTHDEVDANFTNLNTDKIESGDTVASLTLTSADINGGTIDGTVIGGSTPAAISGTTLEASGNVDFKGGDISFYEDTGTTPKFFWDASAESLGIGTSSPSANLEVFSATAGNAELSALKLVNYDYGAGETGQSVSIEGAVRTGAGGVTTAGKIVFGKDSDYSTAGDRDGNIQFYTNLSNTVAERMRIDSSGNVGIGTSSPAGKLDLGGPGDFILSQAADIKWMNTARDTTYGVIEGLAAGTVFKFGSTEHMRIDSSGNVGIGTSSPTQKLQVSGGSFLQQQSGATNNTAPTAVTISNLTTGAHAAGLGASLLFTHVNSGGGYNGPKISSISNADPFTSNLVFYSHNYSHSEAMRIDSSGNLLLGATTALSKLTVQQGFGAAATFNRTNNDGAIAYFAKDGTTVGSIASQGSGTVFDINSLNALRLSADSDNNGAASNSQIQFYIDASEKMRIDSSGNVGIGTSSPRTTFQVAGSYSTLSLPSLGSANFYTSIYTQAATSYGLGVHINNSGDTALQAQSFVSAIAYDMLLQPLGGRVGIGTSSPSATLDVNGSLSKSSGSFKIDHPIKPETHHLVHSFIEGPQADNLYRGKVTLVAGAAAVNLDEAARMTEGTFAALNGNVQCFTTNEDGWTAVRGKVSGNILTIEAQDAACTDTVSWLVIGERHDQHMIEANWTDDQGRIITEPEKEIAE